MAFTNGIVISDFHNCDLINLDHDEYLTFFVYEAQYPLEYISVPFIDKTYNDNGYIILKVNRIYGNKLLDLTQKEAIEFFRDFLPALGCNKQLNDDWYNVD